MPQRYAGRYLAQVAQSVKFRHALTLSDGETGFDFRVSPDSSIQVQELFFRLGVDRTIIAVRDLTIREMSDTTVNGLTYSRLQALRLEATTTEPLKEIFYDQGKGIVGVVWEGWPAVSLVE